MRGAARRRTRLATIGMGLFLAILAGLVVLLVVAPAGSAGDLTALLADRAPREVPVGPRRTTTTVPRPDDAAFVTYEGHEFGPEAVAPTKDRPQSKLWFHDGTWWAVMAHPVRGSVSIHELLSDHTWRDTGVVVDERAASTADTLWDGDHLFVASRTGVGEIRLLRLAYSPGTRRFGVDPGYPLLLDVGGTPSVSIAKDTTGRVWATFIADDVVQVAVTDPAQQRWASVEPAPGPDPQVTDDDTAAIIAVDGHIALMWSDQEAEEFRFTYRGDGAAGWEPIEVPLGGRGLADGHVNLAVTANGRLLAAVKTSLDERAVRPDSPQIVVLERTGPGAWDQHVAGRIADHMTRPVLVVDDDDDRLYLFATSPAGGGAVYVKASGLRRIGFPLGKGVRFLHRPDGQINDPTAFRGPVPAGAPIVVLANDLETRRYYHAELDPHAP